MGRRGQELTGLEDNHNDDLDSALQTFPFLTSFDFHDSFVRQGVKFVEGLWSVSWGISLIT